MASHGRPRLNMISRGQPWPAVANCLAEDGHDRPQSNWVAPIRGRQTSSRDPRFLLRNRFRPHDTVLVFSTPKAAKKLVPCHRPPRKRRKFRLPKAPSLRPWAGPCPPPSPSPRCSETRLRTTFTIFCHEALIDLLCIQSVFAHECHARSLRLSLATARHGQPLAA